MAEITNSKESIFYDISKDIDSHPDAAVMIILGGRNTGKTYSSLRYVYEHHAKFVFVKRTDTDVKMLCGSSDKKYNLDISPFKSLNRDFGWNVQARSIDKGLGGFWNCTEEGEPAGDPVGYIVSINRMGKIKGFDMSDCDYIIFDEFIPRAFERVNRSEGTELVDFYRTVGRANNILQGKVLKLICLANSTAVSCPVLNTFELTDILVDMKSKNESARYLEDRAIFIRLVPDINGFREEELKNPIYKAMKGTKWYKMSLENDFSYNDFTNVKKISLKNYSCLLQVKHKQKTYYIYVGDPGYYMTYRKSNTYNYSYNLNLENDQKKFYYDYVLMLRDECIDDRMKFETYEMYDLIVNYKEFYKV